MTDRDTHLQVSVEVLEEDVELTLAEFCHVCRIPADRALDLVNLGVVEPSGRQPSKWRFQGVSVRRVHRASRLQKDLGVNDAGVALALDLLDELEQLRRRLKRFEGD